MKYTINSFKTYLFESNVKHSFGDQRGIFGMLRFKEKIIYDKICSRKQKINHLQLKGVDR
jgi:hypothetical protein